jgi:hypothetical protein
MAVYGPDRFREHLIVDQLSPGWQEVLARHDADVVIVASKTALAAVLQASGWVVRFEDKVAVVLDPPGRHQ